MRQTIGVSVPATKTGAELAEHNGAENSRSITAPGESAEVGSEIVQNAAVATEVSQNGAPAGATSAGEVSDCERAYEKAMPIRRASWTDWKHNFHSVSESLNYKMKLHRWRPRI